MQLKYNPGDSVPHDGDRDVPEPTSRVRSDTQNLHGVRVPNGDIQVTVSCELIKSLSFVHKGHLVLSTENEQRIVV